MRILALNLNEAKCYHSPNKNLIFLISRPKL